MKMQARWRLGTAVLAAAAVLSACGGASPSTGSAAAAPSPCGGAGAGAVTVAASGYVMSLAAGPVEAMYTPTEVASTHPTTGEVMVRGTMDMQGMSGAGAGMSMSGDMSGMNMSGSAGGQVRHLELHICTQSGSVVTDANPTIRLHDTTDGASVAVPIAVMQGVTSGTSDLHYGNNVSVTLGDSYAADITLNGVTARLRVPIS